MLGFENPPRWLSLGRRVAMAAWSIPRVSPDLKWLVGGGWNRSGIEDAWMACSPPILTRSLEWAAFSQVASRAAGSPSSPAFFNGGNARVHWSTLTVFFLAALYQEKRHYGTMRRDCAENGIPCHRAVEFAVDPEFASASSLAKRSARCNRSGKDDCFITTALGLNVGGCKWGIANSVIGWLHALM
jgi:hypothetical protein